MIIWYIIYGFHFLYVILLLSKTFYPSAVKCAWWILLTQWHFFIYTIFKVNKEQCRSICTTLVHGIALWTLLMLHRISKHMLYTHTNLYPSKVVHSVHNGFFVNVNVSCHSVNMSSCLHCNMQQCSWCLAYNTVRT